MFATYFNHGQLRRYIAAFGSFFNKIQVRRFDASGTELQRMVVPVEFSPKEPWLVRLKQDPDLTKGVSLTVPRMGYEVTGINYDGARKLNTLDTVNFTNPSLRTLARMYVGVPYTLNIDLNILSKTHADAMQIVEQILPYFTPDLTFKLLVLPDLNYFDQIPLTIAGTSQSDTYEQDFLTRRAIIWTLNFSMPVFFYGPSRAQNKIEHVIVDIYNTTGEDLANPPIVLAGEDLSELTGEDGSGHIMSEATPDTYLTTGRVARVQSDATNPTQDPNAPIDQVTTLTEFDGDVKRTITGADESL